MADQRPNRRLKVGVIGGGFGRNHIIAYQACDGVEVAAFCQRTESSAREIAREFGIPRVFTNYRELLAMDGLDAVSIVTPPNLHRAIAAEAFARGLHVLCDKPLAMNRAEAESMLASARYAGRIHMTAFNFRFVPALSRMKELLEEGYVGERIFHLDASWLTEFRILARAPLGWRFKKELAGIGVLGDTGVHLVDLVRWLAGGFRRVCGDAKIYNNKVAGAPGERATVEDSCLLIAELQNGAQATVHASGVARGNVYQSVRIFGSEGALRVDIDRNGPDWVIGRLSGARGPRATLAPVPIPDRLTQGLDLSQPKRVAGEFIFSRLARRFAHGIRTGAQPAPSFSDGLEAQKVIEAVLESVEKKGWIDVD